jgi:putative hydrolase of the HAD superfamily
MTRYGALLLDLGDVIMGAPWIALDDYEAATGRSVPGRGALDPENDPLWEDRLAGRLSYYEYWDRIATRAGFADWRSLYREITQVVPESLVVPDAVALIREAKLAGRRVGVLSNDAYSINDRSFFEGRPEFAGLDAFVDSSDLGVRKPHPGTYLAAAKALGVEPEVVVFLDDTPECVEGARAVGMFGIHVDPQAPSAAFDRARELLGLVTEPRARRLVRMAEEAYGAQNLDAIMRLFHPDAIVHWNGRPVAAGYDEVRRFHIETLGFGETTRHDYRLRKTLRAVQGDTIAVEWTSSYTTADGKPREGRAAEVWTLRGDLLIEWHAYYHRVDDEP